MFSESEINLITAQFQAHYGHVIGMVSRYAPTNDSVDDIVQEVFIEFFSGFAEKKWVIDPEDDSTNWRPLLCHLARHKALQFVRQRARKNRLLDRVAERLREASTTISTGIREDDEETWEEIERRIAAMKRCLEKLPPKSRAIVEQYYLERVPMGRIAEHQKTTLATIRNFFYRIRIKLRECIGKE